MSKKHIRLRQWLESGEASIHPLTFSQRELWETSAVPVADPANHICCFIDVGGLLTWRDCEEAVRRVVERQEVLRLSFLPGKEQPLQLVRRSCEANLELHEVPAGDQKAAIENIARRIFLEPFDMLQGPLYRAVIVRRAPDDHTIVFAIHHAIADGWTLGAFVQDLFCAYIQSVLGMSEPLLPVPLSYTAWAAAERAAWRAAEIKEKAAFWRLKLSGASRIWETRNSSSGLTRWVACIPAELGDAAWGVTRASGATLFSTLFTAFQITLQQWTGSTDFVVGTPVANRGKTAVHETMGYCSGIVPLRANVDPEDSFLESVQAVHQDAMDCFSNAMPFAELASALGESPAPGYHPIFQIRFALQNHPIPGVSLPSISAKLRMRSTGTARFDVGCEITEQDEAMEVAWLYRTHMFSETDIQHLHRMFLAVLASACGSPERAVPDHNQFISVS